MRLAAEPTHADALLGDGLTRARGEARYWREVGSRWVADRPAPLWRRHSDALHTGLLRRWLPPERVNRALKTDLFDEAVSAGLHDHLSEGAKIVVGFDLADSTVRAARARRPELMALIGDARRLPFADRSFDLVVSLSTLDHFHSHDELRASFHEIARIMKTGGLLVLTLDNPLHPGVAVRNRLMRLLGGRLPLVPYFVGATVGPRRLTRMLRRALLEPLEVTTTTHVPRALAIAIASWLDRRSELGEGLERRFLQSLAGWERMGTWPTRFLTGHYVAVQARRM